MGLAGQFGNETFVCQTCRQTMSSYSPHCPFCLKRTVRRVEPDKGPVGSFDGPAPVSEQHPGGALIPYGLVIGVIAVAVAIFAMLARPDSLRSQHVDISPQASPVPPNLRISSQQPRHIRRPSAHHEASIPVRAHPPTAATSARPGTPMKLWQVSGDGE
jgi:hypothetical protein